MSDSSMVWKPRMEEPSKPRPSSKMSSLSSETGMEKCCQRPGRSMKRRSTILAPFSLAIFTTSFGVMRQPPCPLAWDGNGDRQGASAPQARQDYEARFAPSSAPVGFSPPCLMPGARLGFRRLHGLREGAGAGPDRILPVGRASQYIGRLRVLGEIEARHFVLLGHPQPHDGVQHLEDDRGHHKAQDPGHDDGDELYPELVRVAVEEPVATRVVDGLG